MISRFSLPVTLMSAVGLITLGFLAPWGATKALADPGGDRLGCGTYCQNAGGYGGAAGGPTQPPVTVVSNRTVTAEPDGYVPVPVACSLSVQCLGALMVDLRVTAGTTDSFGDPVWTHVGDGRSDLVVDAGATRTIAVPVQTSVIAYLRSHGPTTLSIMGDVGQSRGQTANFTNIFHGDLTVAPPG
jgi:hypothetical protein